MREGGAGGRGGTETGLKVRSRRPMGRNNKMAGGGGRPVTRLDARNPATARAVERTGMRIEDFDLYEINEALASMPLAWLRATGADPDRLNVNGGAIALGHPLGASGTKLMSTLIYALNARGGRYARKRVVSGQSV